jgi:hypothetical protein
MAAMVEVVSTLTIEQQRWLIAHRTKIPRLLALVDAELIKRRNARIAA